MQQTQLARLAPHVGFCGLIALHQPEVICDVGSMDGEQAVRFKRICPRSSVIAFEANRRNYDLITADPHVQGSGVVVEHLAVSDTTGPAEFNVVDVPDHSPWARGVSSLRERRGDYAAGFTSTKTTVDAVRLDDYLADTSGPVALWIDVEGALDQVVRGLASLADRIVTMHVEAELVEVWEGQASWADLQLEIRRLGPFRTVATGPEFGEVQHNYLLVREDVLRRRSTRALLAVCSQPGGHRMWVPVNGDPWRGIASRLLSRVAQRL
jgi:FkbM family methyltransferase